MTDTHETIADIIAEKRRQADEIERDCAEKMKRGEMISDQYARELVADIRREADRLEAAHRRERGDCAKLREALEMVCDAHYTKEVGGELYEGFEVEVDDGTGRPLICVVKDALSAPPRNCDLPKAAEDPWRAWMDDKSNWEDGYPKLEIHEWLLATATEKEKGEPK